VASFRETLMALSPTAYWWLDETSGTNANEEIAGLDGTYTGSPTLGVTGLIAEGTAVDFERGSAQYVSVADDAAWDNASSLSMLMVVQFETAPGSFQWYGGIAHTGGALTTAGQWRWYFFNDSTSSFGFQWWTTSEQTERVAWTPTAGVRYLVGMTWDSSAQEVKFYVNGSQQGATQATNAGTIGSTATNTLTIGRMGQTDANHFDGVIDEVAYWKDTVLTSTNFSDLNAALDNPPGGAWPPEGSDNAPETLRTSQSTLRLA
jgi:hypothetical protein